MAEQLEADSVENDFVKLSPAEAEVSSSWPGVEEVGSTKTKDDEEDLYGPGTSEVEPARSNTGLGQGNWTRETTKAPESSVKSDKKSESSGTCCMSCCSMMKNLDPKFVDLVLWTDIKKTGIIFGSSLLVLISLALCSILSVLAYLSLVVLTMTATYRLYRIAMATFKHTNEGHPFKKFLDVELTVSTDTVHHFADLIASHTTKAADELRRLFFVEEIVPSLKFGLILWVLTYIGSWLNGITLVIIADILLFTLPKVYKTYKVQIDHFAELVCAKSCDTWKKIQEKFPVLSKKKQA